MLRNTPRDGQRGDQTLIQKPGNQFDRVKLDKIRECPPPKKLDVWYEARAWLGPRSHQKCPRQSKKGPDPREPWRCSPSGSGACNDLGGKVTREANTQSN